MLSTHSSSVLRRLITSSRRNFMLASIMLKCPMHPPRGCPGVPRKITEITHVIYPYTLALHGQLQATTTTISHSHLSIFQSHTFNHITCIFWFPRGFIFSRKNKYHNLMGRVLKQHKSTSHTPLGAAAAICHKLDFYL